MTLKLFKLESTIILSELVFGYNDTWVYLESYKDFRPKDNIEEWYTYTQNCINRIQPTSQTLKFTYKTYFENLKFYAGRNRYILLESNVIFQSDGTFLWIKPLLWFQHIITQIKKSDRMGSVWYISLRLIEKCIKWMKKYVDIRGTFNLSSKNLFSKLNFLKISVLGNVCEDYCYSFWFIYMSLSIFQP